MPLAARLRDPHDAGAVEHCCEELRERHGGESLMTTNILHRESIVTDRMAIWGARRDDGVGRRSQRDQNFKFYTNSECCSCLEMGAILELRIEEPQLSSWKFLINRHES